MQHDDTRPNPTKKKKNTHYPAPSSKEKEELDAVMLGSSAISKVLKRRRRENMQGGVY